jgi:hypothetical protein
VTIARAHARPVSPHRLGHVGREAFPNAYYAAERGTAQLGSGMPQAEIPFVIEAWARLVAGDKCGEDIDVRLLINRTPTIAQVSAWRDADGLNVHGSGLFDNCSDAPKKGAYRVRVNIITPLARSHPMARSLTSDRLLARF